MAYEVTSWVNTGRQTRDSDCVDSECHNQLLSAPIAVLSGRSVRYKSQIVVKNVQCQFYAHLPLKHFSALAALLYWQATGSVSFP